MKTYLVSIILIVVSFFFTSTTIAQNLGFTYQAVAIDKSQSEGFGRDSQGEVLANRDIDLRFTILEGNENGPAVYQETHIAKTDVFGIFRLIVGRGNISFGNRLEDLNWGEISYFMQVEIDLGNGYEFLGVEELLGSPYALNAKMQNLTLNNNELSISGGNSVVLSDNDPTNELVQGVTLSGSILTLTDAGGDTSVDLSTLPNADNSNTNELQTISKTGSTVTLSNSGGSFTDEVNDADFDPANEIQNISTDGTAGNISLSSGATLGLNVNDADNDPNNEIELPASAANNQVLKWNGTNWVAGADEVNDADFDPANEIQNISTDGTAGNISLSSGATLGLNVNDADNDPTNEIELPASAANNQVLKWDGTNWVAGADEVNDADFDPANEIQDLQLTGNALAITVNASPTIIDLSPYLDAAFSTASNVTSNAPGDYTTDDFVVGSPQLDDNGNINNDSRMFFDKSKGAFRAGYVTGTEWDDANRGLYSVAMGYNTIASGNHSTTMGTLTTASGLYSTALGRFSIASGNYSTALGHSTNASSTYSTALGLLTTASGQAATTMGYQTTASGGNSTAMGYQTTASGGSSTAMGSQTTASGSNSTAMGYQTTASGAFSTAMGWGTIASGGSSTAMGSQTTASGSGSTAMGGGTDASGINSTAMGSVTDASGLASTAMGAFTTASGLISTAMGLETFAKSYAETSIGLFNTDYVPNSTLAFNSADRLFVIGNGVFGARSDALIIYKNGNATLAGTLTQLSDARLKDDITPLTTSLEKVVQLQGVHYKWNAVKPHDMESLQTGLIAQEIEKILPELVKEASDGYKSVNYVGLIPHLIEAVKELEAKNALLKQESNKKIKDLEERLLRLEKLIEPK